MIEHEDAFIDLAFELGGVEGMEASEVKNYIRYIADRRLTQLGLPELFKIEKNPLPWMDEMLNAVEHTNFLKEELQNIQEQQQLVVGQKHSRKHLGHKIFRTKTQFLCSRYRLV